MKKFFALAALFTLLAAPSFATTPDKFVVPKQTIVGAEVPIPLGEIVDLSASTIDTPPQYLVSTSYLWQVTDGGKPKHVRETAQGGIYFGSGVVARHIPVLCIVTYLYEVKNGDNVVEAATRTVLLTADVNIGGTPPPAPFGDALTAAYASETDPQKSDEAKWVAAVLRAEVNYVKSGSHKTIGDLMKGVNAAVAARVPKGALGGCLAATAQELVASLGGDDTKSLDVTVTAAELNRVATAWEGLK